MANWKTADSSSILINSHLHLREHWSAVLPVWAVKSLGTTSLGCQVTGNWATVCSSLNPIEIRDILATTEHCSWKFVSKGGDQIHFELTSILLTLKPIKKKKFSFHELLSIWNKVTTKEVYDSWTKTHAETFSCVFVLFQVMSWLFSFENSKQYKNAGRIRTIIISFIDYVHTVSFSLAFYIVLRPQGIRKQMKPLRKRHRVHIWTNKLHLRNGDVISDVLEMVTSSVTS